MIHDSIRLQELCELGQEALVRTDYLRAESLLVEADALATMLLDFDTLSRLYMPLQEARRQRRQRCGEGVVRLDLIAQSAAEPFDAEQIVAKYPHGQLLVAAWKSIEPALHIRSLQRERNLFVETFLGIALPISNGPPIVVIIPEALDARLIPNDTETMSIAQVIGRLPYNSQVYRFDELPAGERRGTTQTYAEIMAMWEQLSRPFLKAGDYANDLQTKINTYRRAIEVDYACELAHQNLSAAAAKLSKLRAAESN